ncbi:nuclear transport factor 2 family protein [Tomitella cavernea]|uniref:Nuclear transport factor 2 family protein n=1 Tax=Tomitella cavernea TaxID=1387982 RepID=A0ABP9CHB6_9ACTN|nr:nuclear transport factor 2 family protein [Tomitella cavernea]
MTHAAPADPALATLVAIEEIKRLKHRYLRCLDGKDWEPFTDTLAPSITAKYGKYTFDDRDALVAFMRKHMGRKEMLTEHFVAHPEITVDGDTAHGYWHLSDTVLIPSQGVMLRGAAVYDDDYARGEDGQWRITRTGYERAYEYVVKLEDLPSFTVTANKWA